jgi:hypothetical protein
MANSLGRPFSAVNDALSNPAGTTPQMQAPQAVTQSAQQDGTAQVNPGAPPTNPKGAQFFKQSHTPHGSSGFERAAGALADRIHKYRGVGGR